MRIHLSLFTLIGVRIPFIINLGAMFPVSSCIQTKLKAPCGLAQIPILGRQKSVTSSQTTFPTS